MSTFPVKSLRLWALALGVALAVGSPALAADVSVQLDAGGGFSIKNSTGAVQRLRVDEATGNLSRNGALFAHTTGPTNLFVGPNAGNVSTSGFGGNAAFGYSALRNLTTGGANAAVGTYALRRNTTGSNNSAVGFYALWANTTGLGNSAVGAGALGSNTIGNRNSVVGSYALGSNTTGTNNSAFGHAALQYNTAGGNNSAFGGYTLRNSYGSSNSAVGFSALRNNSAGGNNSAFGNSALQFNTTGNGNLALGIYAGTSQTTGSSNIYLANIGGALESNTIRIGTPAPGTVAGLHSRAFIAGIRGTTTLVADAIPVLIDSSGQLGTASSSRNVKNDIRDMGDATARLLDLRPVTFHYKQQQTLPSGGEVPPEYGLIAEEVAEVFPDLVVYDEAGQPFTVKYHEMAPMLLNEMKKQRHTIEAQRQAEETELQAQRQAYENEIAVLTTRLAQLETRLGGAPGEAQR